MIFHFFFFPLFAFILTLLILRYLIKRNINFGLIAQPNDQVKTHVRPTPLIGGVGIFASIIIIALVAHGETGFSLSAYFSGLAPVGLLGLYKDRFPDSVAPKVQLIFQIITSLILYTYFLDVNNLVHNWVGMSFFIVFCCVIINAFNFIDVMDGLAGGYLVSVFIVIGAISMWKENHGFAMMIFSFTGALLGFLRFNWHPAKVFMGDLGSFGLGYSLIFMLISVCPAKSNYSYLGYFLVFFVLFLEFGFTCVVRILLKRSPLSGDENHISLILLRKGNKSEAIVIYEMILTIATNLIAAYYLI